VSRWLHCCRALLRGQIVHAPAGVRRTTCCHSLIPRCVVDVDWAPSVCPPPSRNHHPPAIMGVRCCPDGPGVFIPVPRGGRAESAHGAATRPWRGRWCAVGYTNIKGTRWRARLASGWMGLNLPRPWRDQCPRRRVGPRSPPRPPAVRNYAIGDYTLAPLLAGFFVMRGASLNRWPGRCRSPDAAG
jgi:hypothetical protein